MAGYARGQTSSWLMIGYDTAHTGFNAGETELHPPFPVDYSLPMLIGIQGLSSKDGIVFATGQSDTNLVRAMDLATGDTLWTFTIPGSGGSSNNTPAVWDTLVYAGGQGATHMHCINAKTGEEVWSYPTGSLYTNHITVDDGRVYVNPGDSLYCLDGLTGGRIWARSTQNNAVPAIKGDLVYSSLLADSLAALDKLDGSVVWEVQANVERCVIVAGDSLLFFKTSGDEVEARRLADGSFKWSRIFPGEEVADADRGCLAYAYDKLCVTVWTDAMGMGKVYALSASDGAPVWDYTFKGEGAFVPVVANSAVYVACWEEWVLYVLDAESGDSIAAFEGLQYNYIVSEGSLIAREWNGLIRVLRMEPLGTGEPDPEGPPLPAAAHLDQNYPNPFNPETTIGFDLAGNAEVKLEVYDLRGRLVVTLLNGVMMQGGHHRLVWNGKDMAGQGVPSGIYFSRLTAIRNATSRKMVLLR
jgi:outer membrane protein assembly factor BamB